MSEEPNVEQAKADNHAVCTECGEPAVFSFVWPWGQSGYCCANHAVVLRHRSQALEREIQLLPLRPGAPSPVTQDERVTWHAKLLAAEDQIVEVKTRNLRLFDANETLTAEVKRLTVEATELRSQLADARAEADQLTSEKMQALKQLAETNHELARLQGVLDAAAQLPTPPPAS
jgi:regulator of replication initiation timing